jgi:transaldolase
MISEGRSINVTLIFSLDRYSDVMEAYLSGLESCPGDLSTVSSVASFFISRTDVEVDRRLDQQGGTEALALRGRMAVAQGQVAYDMFRSMFSGPRWEALVQRGARVQRPLWASTSTKNPSYPDTLYVDTLIGPDTVNTLPDATLEAFEDHGTVARTVDADPDAAHAVLRAVSDAGIDLADVARVLEDEGVAAFVASSLSSSSSAAALSTSSLTSACAASTAAASTGAICAAAACSPFRLTGTSSGTGNEAAGVPAAVDAAVAAFTAVC